MRIALHAGAHCTDDDKLLKCLLRNADRFRENGVAVPGPGRYRALLSDTLHSLGDAMPSPEAREVLLDAILTDDSDQVSGMILSHENFFSPPRQTFVEGQYYHRAESRLRGMVNLFDGDEVELFLAVRNPASFLPALFATTPYESLGELLQGANPLHLRWAHLVDRIRKSLPDMPITVWCNEDSPLIWGEIVRSMAGLPSGARINGAFDMLSEIMQPEGMKRFRAYLGENPTINEEQKRRVMLAFLDKYAKDDELEEELDVPGWDEGYVETLTELYDDDLELISRIEGVTILEP